MIGLGIKPEPERVRRALVEKFEKNYITEPVYQYCDERELLAGIVEHLNMYGDEHLSALVAYNKNGVFAVGQDMIPDINAFRTRVPRKH